MIDFIIQFCRSREQLYNKSYTQEKKTDPSVDFFKGKGNAFTEMIEYLQSLNNFLRRMINGDNPY